MTPGRALPARPSAFLRASKFHLRRGGNAACCGAIG